MSMPQSKQVPHFGKIPEDYFHYLGSFLAEKYEQYGPIFQGTSTVLGSDVTYLVGPEANRFIMSSDRLKFSHHIGWGGTLGIVGALGNGLLTMDGAEHDQHRRMMNPAFTINYMAHYLPIMSRNIEQRMATWGKHGEIDIYEEMRKINFDIAAEALVGLNPGPEVDTFRTLFVQILRLRIEMQGKPIEEFESRREELRQQLFDLLLPKIQERRKQPTDDILGMMVQARDDAGQALTDEQLIAHTNILLVAGHETSTSLGSWLLYLLVENPDYMQRVLDEQTALLGNNPTAALTLDDIKRMTVLDNALSEAERLYPPVGGAPRGVVESFEFNGYTVPAGTFVYCGIAGSHLIPSIFADPTRFDPDRFAAPREEDKKTPYALVGFGGGPRICIGINFAQVEIKAMASQVLRRYTLKLVPDQQISQFYHGTGMPLHGIKMQVFEREKTHA